MILTITPNPSIDRTLQLGPLARGAVQRARSATVEAGGKGINVARALTADGRDARALVPLNEASAAVVRALLGDTVDLEVVPIAGDVRVNVGLVEDDGTVTKVNEPGPVLSGGEVEAILARSSALAARADWVVGCGSLPQGVPTDFYAQLARRMPPGVRVAIDADGMPLRACVGQPLALLKPNQSELETAVGSPLDTLGAVIDAAGQLVHAGCAAVLVSLGAAGAVYVDRDGATHADARIDHVVNTVGAGDALLAGFLAAGGGRAALGTAVAWSVAACRSPGTRMLPVSDADRARVTIHEQADRALRLAA